MATIIRFDNVPNKTYVLELEGTVYRVNIRYNTIDQKWYFALEDSNGVRLLSGQKITVRRPMLDQFRRPTFPGGDFIFLLPTVNRDPRRDDIDDLVLYYFTESEYEQFFGDL